MFTSLPGSSVIASACTMPAVPIISAAIALIFPNVVMSSSLWKWSGLVWPGLVVQPSGTGLRGPSPRSARAMSSATRA